MSDARKIEIRPIDPDDDGVDRAWLELPGDLRLDLFRRFMEACVRFEREVKGADISYRMDRTANVFEGLPRSQAAFYARLRREKVEDES